MTKKPKRVGGPYGRKPYTQRLELSAPRDTRPKDAPIPPPEKKKGKEEQHNAPLVFWSLRSISLMVERKTLDLLVRVRFSYGVR